VCSDFLVHSNMRRTSSALAGSRPSKGCLQSNYEMNVVSDAANSLWGCLESLHGAAQILMEGGSATMVQLGCDLWCWIRDGNEG